MATNISKESTFFQHHRFLGIHVSIRECIHKTHWNTIWKKTRNFWVNQNGSKGWIFLGELFQLTFAVVWNIRIWRWWFYITHLKEYQSQIGSCLRPKSCGMTNNMYDIYVCSSTPQAIFWVNFGSNLFDEGSSGIVRRFDGDSVFSQRCCCSETKVLLQWNHRRE